jgi:hypothetical protein
LTKPDAIHARAEQLKNDLLVCMDGCWYPENEAVSIIEAALLAEIEACGRFAETSYFPHGYHSEPYSGVEVEWLVKQIGAAIRARKESHERPRHGASGYGEVSG